MPLLLFSLTSAQNKLDINAKFDPVSGNVLVRQAIEYTPNVDKATDTIYLSDWSNSYSTKKTSLARRFAEEFSTKFHFAKSEERGFTSITAVADKDGNNLGFTRLKKHPDVIAVVLNKPVSPGESYQVLVDYTIKLPSTKFTDYGLSPSGDIRLKYWYLTPVIYDGRWNYYSNKDLNDLFIPIADINLQLQFPRNYIHNSELDLITTTQFDGSQIVVLSGKNRVDSKLFLTRAPLFKTIQTDDFTVLSDINEENIASADRAIITDKITRFITKNLGPYPHKTLMVTSIDARKDPIYGLNQLPKFIRPFPPHFKYELTLLKNTLGNYLDNVLLINPRRDQWLRDGLQIYFLIKYIETNYPDMKLLGSLADIWGIRSFHASDLAFNEQYQMIYMHMARTNRDQPLSKAKDSLLKFNSSLANKYKAGVGLKYLDDFINRDILEESIKEFLATYNFKETKPEDFETLLKSKTDKDIDWFFKEFVGSRKKIDFKIKRVEETGDSILVTIKNKRENSMPVSLFALNKDSVVSKTWISDIGKTKTVKLPRGNIDQLVLNYDNTIPEYNLRDNWKSLNGFFGNSKPLQFRLFKDVEDPHYNQIFFMPLVEFRNIYDGLVLGTKLYNKTVLRKNFNYRISPEYGTRSKTLTGSGSITYLQNVEESDLFLIQYGFAAGYNSFAEDLFLFRYSPFVNFSFRDSDDFRSNERQLLTFRYLDINRDEDVNNILTTTSQDPDYNVFNARYIYSDDNLINFKKWFADLQFAKTFGKISFNYEYRRLFENNRQLNLRFFLGSFIYNNNPDGFDYFSFALDRPTDYLFDYNYLGRSEASGIFSQQIIIAEGGFKSQLDTPFANRWLATANLSTTLWKYIQAYGDIGLVKNRGIKPQFVYDSGIRINLVADYFEIYFPVYSNLGWEIAQPNYDQKIRFLFTVDPQTLLGLFRRKWY